MTGTSQPNPSGFDGKAEDLTGKREERMRSLHQDGNALLVNLDPDM